MHRRIWLPRTLRQAFRRLLLQSLQSQRTSPRASMRTRQAGDFVHEFDGVPGAYIAGIEQEDRSEDPKEPQPEAPSSNAKREAPLSKWAASNIWEEPAKQHKSNERNRKRNQHGTDSWRPTGGWEDRSGARHVATVQRQMHLLRP